MKDESSGVPIKGSAGLKSKMKTFITEDNHESKGKKALVKVLLMMFMMMLMMITKMFCSINHI